jgi:hypothetical protein
MKKLILLAIILLSATKSNAFYIQDYTLPEPVLGKTSGFYDTRTNQTWLDLPCFLTYDQIQSGLLNTDFHLASSYDVNELVYTWTSSPDEPDNRWTETNYMGTHSTDVAMGWFEDGSMQLWRDENGKAIALMQSDYIAHNYGDQAVGGWIMRNDLHSAVAPEPATWALLMLGLLFIYQTKRRFA